MNPDEKTCPDCAESVKAAARKCKHCGFKFLLAESSSSLSQGTILDAADVEALLSSLVDRSLVVFDHPTGRYRLLETVRQYARERLAVSGEADACRNRHLARFVSLATEAESQLAGADQLPWFDRLHTEHDNLRSALARSIDTEETAEGALRICGTMWRFWASRGHIGEGRKWCGSALGKAPQSSNTLDRARALGAAGILALRQGDIPSARSLHEESLSIRQELGDRQGVAQSLGNLANVAYDQGDYESSRASNEQSLAIKREMGDLHGIASSVNNLGILALDRNDLVAARTLYSEGLAIRRELGDRQSVASSLDNLGNVECALENHDLARSLFEESLSIRRELDDRFGEAISLENLGDAECVWGDFAAATALLLGSLAIRLESGDRSGIATTFEVLACATPPTQFPLRSARLWGWAEALREEIGAPTPPRERERIDGLIAIARQAAGDNAAFESAWKVGRAMTLEQAAEYARCY